MNRNFLDEEERILVTTVRDFANEVLAPRAAEYDRSEEFPWDNMKGIAELGLLGLTIDEKYGGAGGTTRQLALVVQEIAKACASTSVVYVAHLSLCTQFINMFGKESQKVNYIPSLVTGDKIGAFALTEPGAGSDAAAIETSSREDGETFTVNGTKTYISNAPEASVIVTLVTNGREKGHRGIDALIVDGGLGGMQVNKITGKMGVRASTVGEIIFDDCSVPKCNMINDEGNGFYQTMEVLNTSRISIAAQCVGIAQAAYEASVQYAKTRKAFGGSLADLQAIQWMVADMATELEAAKLLVMKAADLRDQSLPFVKEASMAKLFASRVAMDAAYKAVQIHGGAGYFAPAAVERYFRDARVTEIYEGTSEIQRLVIANNIFKEL